jgi:hypothetical protein
MYGLDYDFSRMKSLVYRTMGELNWSIYAQLASSYSKRLLTNAQDRMPAFLALSETMKRDLFLGAPLLWGLPVTDLFAALLWRRCLGCVECANKASGLTRISEGGPSWSWSGWLGHVHYSDYVLGNGENPALAIIPVARFKEPVFEDGNSGLVAFVAESGPLTASSGDRPRNDTPSPLADWVKRGAGFAAPRGSTGTIYTHPFDENSLSKRKWLVQERGLVVDTEVASFIVFNRLHRDLPIREYHPQIYNDKHKALYMGKSVGNPLGIYDPKTGYFCGALFDDLDLELPRPQGLGTKLPIMAKFVKLSVSVVSDRESISNLPHLDINDIPSIAGLMDKLRGERANFGPDAIRQHFDTDKYDCSRRWCMYNVLMVVYMNSTQNIAHRVGVGKIHVDAFDSAPDLARKNIVLG